MSLVKRLEGLNWEPSLLFHELNISKWKTINLFGIKYFESVYEKAKTLLNQNSSLKIRQVGLSLLYHLLVFNKNSILKKLTAGSLEEFLSGNFSNYSNNNYQYFISVLVTVNVFIPILSIIYYT